MSRCDAVQPTRGLRCELDAGHDGVHMHGLGPGANGVTAWGWTT